MKLLNLYYKKLVVFVLVATFLLALILRLYSLSSIPTGFHIDEASKGYTAFSILKTGKDDNGNMFPLYVDIFGDNSPSGYHVLTTIPVAIFGLSEFAVRLPGAIIGALSIFAIYFLSYALFKNRKVAVLSAFLLSVSPWHIILSRASSESLVALFFILLGFGYIINSLRSEKIKELVIGCALLSLSFFFYQTPRLFVPLMFFSILIFYIKFWSLKLSKKFIKTLIFSFLAICILNFSLIFIAPGGSGRFAQVNIFTYPETKLILDEQIREDGVIQTNNLVTRAFHNKAINFPRSYISNYFEYFSFNFLFINNLPPWYFVPGVGVMHLIFFPFILYGLFLLARDNNKLYRIPLIWLVIAPVAAATAVDTNNLQRAIVLFPILEILAAFGILHVSEKLKKIKFVFILFLSIGILFSAFYFLHQYFNHSPIHKPWYRNAGFKEMMEYVNINSGKFETVVLTKTGGGYPLVQFYAQYDPATYQKEGSPKDKPYGGFGKFFFVDHECPSLEMDNKIPQKKVLFINNGICKKDIRYTEEVIYRTDNTPAFRIVNTNSKLLPNPEKLELDRYF